MCLIKARISNGFVVAVMLRLKIDSLVSIDFSLWFMMMVLYFDSEWKTKRHFHIYCIGFFEWLQLYRMSLKQIKLQIENEWIDIEEKKIVK